ncbi:MAG: U32 family peptidase, partial [Treponema sp.]|nr:U32 family peptidase [Treponema sp.]
VTGEDYSVVIPSRPFSMVDRIPFLRKEGVGKFILDFSHVELTKQLYRQVMKAAEEGKVLPDTSRFNWKNGFWQPEENPAGD